MSVEERREKLEEHYDNQMSELARQEQAISQIETDIFELWDKWRVAQGDKAKLMRETVETIQAYAAGGVKAKQVRKRDNSWDY